MKLNIPYKSGVVRVTSPYGNRVLNGVSGFHKGIDLVGTVKTIAAPCDGRIGWAGLYDDKASGGRTWEWGNYVRLETSDGYMVYMCHMASVAVKIGQDVRDGDVIGVEGSTGYSTGSHLHFEVRYGGKSLDPTTLMDISNRVGSYPVTNVLASTKRSDKYTLGGLTFQKMKNPRLEYLDKPKWKAAGRNVCNANFFGNFRNSVGFFTLPVGNLVCDMDTVPAAAENLLGKLVSGGKLRYGCADNAANSEFRQTKPSTLIIPKVGKPYVEEVAAAPADCLYAVSGVPCVRHSDDVDWHRFVKPQGWGDGAVVNTYHNWVGIRDGELWVITGKSAAKSGNMIYGMWFWDIVKGEGFTDILKMDGGGSYLYRSGYVNKAGSAGTRQISAVWKWE